MKTTLFALLIPAVFLTGCRPNKQAETTHTIQTDSLVRTRNLEAREDSMEMALALEAQAMISAKITAFRETEAVGSPQGDDAADDPAIWYNTVHPEKSLVLGTDKNTGIYVYNLHGKVQQFRPTGRINNIDLREGFSYQGSEQVLVAGSNRSRNAIQILLLDPLTTRLSDSLFHIPSMVDEVYGICCYHSPVSRKHYIFVNGKGGILEQWEISHDRHFKAQLHRNLKLNSQPEGMVADDENEILYVGVEEEGIFFLDAEPDGDSLWKFLPGSDSLNPQIRYDVEGLALFPYQGEPYLLASSQGNFSYAIFRLGEQPAYLKSFIIEGGNVDGAEETDGLEILSRPLGTEFPDGLLVVQDGFNTDGQKARSQNFKLVDFSRVLELID
jgi:3-phytase